ncbi:Exosome complex component CSL4 [Paramuricea clavata]|uniref:Exosome complex component CSL4 n=1 Tax=Paramuricea clavata TaxID=317549 RepID=A0A7D9D574_PARCT|nr:Exosome complex component CSL4 [Paramuricea clavata]
MKGSVEKAKKKHDVVVPGEFLGSAEEYKSGEGTYVRFCQVYANRSGFKVVEKPNENESVISVIRDKHSQVLPTIGAVVTAKVTGVNTRFCKLAILAVEGCPLNEPFRGTLRKEDIRATEKDKVEIYKSFRPGDIVQARVSSLGDSHSYSLSTAENELGVIFAMSEAGASMIPISWKEMQCPETKAKEFRKVAKVQQQ